MAEDVLLALLVVLVPAPPHLHLLCALLVDTGLLVLVVLLVPVGVQVAAPCHLCCSAGPAKQFVQLLRGPLLPMAEDVLLALLVVPVPAPLRMHLLCALLVDTGLLVLVVLLMPAGVQAAASSHLCCSAGPVKQFVQLLQCFLLPMAEDEGWKQILCAQLVDAALLVLLVLAVVLMPAGV